MKIVGKLEQVRQIEAAKIQAQSALDAMRQVACHVQVTDGRGGRYVEAQALLHEWLDELMARQNVLMMEIANVTEGDDAAND